MSHVFDVVTRTSVVSKLNDLVVRQFGLTSPIYLVQPFHFSETQ